MCGGEETFIQGFWGVNMRKRDNLADVFIGWIENIKMSLQEIGWGEWARIIWLRVGTGDRLL